MGDLSPFYLEQARKTHAKYSKITGRGREPTFVQADGASLPFSDQEFDVVICMYVFHELPEQARADVAREMARVCSGLVVLTDSIQRGDRPKLDDSIANFKKFNEPYYDTFLEEDLGALVEVNGFKPYEKHLCSVTKTLSLTREVKAEAAEPTKAAKPTNASEVVDADSKLGEDGLLERLLEERSETLRNEIPSSEDGA